MFGAKYGQVRASQPNPSPNRNPDPNPNPNPTPNPNQARRERRKAAAARAEAEAVAEGSSSKTSTSVPPRAGPLCGATMLARCGVWKVKGEATRVYCCALSASSTPG